MIFLRMCDDIAAIAPLRHAAASLYKHNIRTVDDLLSAPPDRLSPRLLDIARKLSEGAWEYAVPELGLPLPDTAGRVFWSLDDAGLLTICGSGQVPDYTDSRRPPWDSLRSRIRSLRIEEQVSRLGALAFRDCPNLTQVTCGFALRRIGTGAFRNCRALETLCASLPLVPLRDLERTDMPTPAIRFGHYAFAGTPWAQANLGEFYVCGTRLMEYHGSSRHIRIPEGITEICPMVFENMPIEAVEFPDSLLTIRDFAFRGTGLTKLELPSKLQQVGNRAFGGCQKLELVCIGNRQMEAHPAAFADTPLAACSRKVNGRWASRYGINLRPEEGMAEFLAMQSGISDTHPMGLKNFYPRTDFLNLLRQGNLLVRVELDPENRLAERIFAYSLDRTCGILWNDGWWDEFDPCQSPAGEIDLSCHYRTRRTTRQLRSANICGLTLARRSFPVMWYCVPNPKEDVPSLIHRFLGLWLAGHPDYRLPAREAA